MDELLERYFDQNLFRHEDCEEICLAVYEAIDKISPLEEEMIVYGEHNELNMDHNPIVLYDTVMKPNSTMANGLITIKLQKGVKAIPCFDGKYATYIANQVVLPRKRDRYVTIHHSEQYPLCTLETYIGTANDMSIRQEYIFRVQYLEEIEDQILFVRSLSDEYLKLFDIYTSGSFDDINMGGNYKSTDKLFTLTELYTLRKNGMSVQRFIDGLDSLFETVPPLETELLVFRGGCSSLENRRYISVTLLPRVATDFMELRGLDTPTLLRIKLLPGAKVLPILTLLGNSESEILIKKDQGMYEVLW